MRAGEGLRTKKKKRERIIKPKSQYKGRKKANPQSESWRKVGPPFKRLVTAKKRASRRTVRRRRREGDISEFTH